MTAKIKRVTKQQQKTVVVKSVDAKQMYKEKVRQGKKTTTGGENENVNEWRRMEESVWHS